MGVGDGGGAVYTAGGSDKFAFTGAIGLAGEGDGGKGFGVGGGGKGREAKVRSEMVSVFTPLLCGIGNVASFGHRDGR